MYRGATPPILNSFVLNAIMFAGHGHGSRVLHGHGLTDASRTFLAGSYAGALQVLEWASSVGHSLPAGGRLRRSESSPKLIHVLQVVALVPVDAVKCRMQIDRATHGSAGLYSGPLDCMRQVRVRVRVGVRARVRARARVRVRVRVRVRARLRVRLRLS